MEPDDPQEFTSEVMMKRLKDAGVYFNVSPDGKEVTIDGNLDTIELKLAATQLIMESIEQEKLP